jgi:hypothetical protein
MSILGKSILGNGRARTRRTPIAVAAACVGLAAAPAAAQAADTVPPVSAAQVPACTGVVSIGVADFQGGDGPAGANYRIDGGPQGFSPVGISGDPNVALVRMPEGLHSLEYWGVDRAGNQEANHHTAIVRTDRTQPSLAVSGDNVVRRGERASVRVQASDPSGLSTDPSTSGRRLDTASAGRKRLTFRAVDRCGNLRAADFDYAVAAPPRVRIARNFAILVDSDVGLRRASVVLDGRRLRVRVRPELSVRMPRRIRRGRHRLTVTVVDRAGNRVRRSRRVRF